MDLAALVLVCAANVAPETMLAVIEVESAGNPNAIGVVDGRLARQPTSRAEALSTIAELETQGWNYSVGLAQVNRSNFARFGVTAGDLLEPCTNVRTGAAILAECYGRALVEHGGEEASALRSALSCYYSGNFTTGQRADETGTSYVERVIERSTDH